MVWANAIVQGILLGGLYALFATGLSLAFGVMRFVNLAHGDLAILAAFVTLSLATTMSVNPLFALIIVIPLAFGAGYLLQRLVFDRVVGVDPAFQIVATFGFGDRHPERAATRTTRPTPAGSTSARSRPRASRSTTRSASGGFR